MILYSPRSVSRLPEYGIHVPAMPGRAERILAELRKSKVIGDLFCGRLVEDENTELSRADLLRAHTDAYVSRIFAPDPTPIVEAAFELRSPDGSTNRFTPKTATRSLADLRDNRIANAAGTYRCGTIALDTGFCFYLGGGSHHAHPAFGHGFCIINDAAVAVRRLQAEGQIRSAWIIDVDAHKGDGTAAITERDPSITTLSVHMAHGWPLDRPEYLPNGERHPSFIPSDIDVPIASGDEKSYCDLLAKALEHLTAFSFPDFAVVLLGADPYEYDELPSTAPLKLSIGQLAERDAMIFDFLTSRNIPQAHLMAGGYGERAWEPYPPFLELAFAASYDATT